MAANLVMPNSIVAGVQLVIFDKDGTLMDVHGYWANMVRMRADALRARLGLDQETTDGLMDRMGVDVASMRIKPAGPVGLRKREIVLDAGEAYLRERGFDDINDVLVDVFRQIDDDSLRIMGEIVKPIAGAVELVKALRAHGCLVAVATNDRGDRAARAIEHLGIDRDVSCIAGADMVHQPKPAPEIVERICERLGVEPARTVMVGDSPADMESGHTAGCLECIGVTSGLSSPEELREWTSIVLGSVAEIDPRRAEPASDRDETAKKALGHV